MKNGFDHTNWFSGEMKTAVCCVGQRNREALEACVSEGEGTGPPRQYILGQKVRPNSHLSCLPFLTSLSVVFDDDQIDDRIGFLNMHSI